MSKLLNLIAKRPRQWMVSKSTTFVGIILIAEAIANILRHLISPGDLDTSVIEAQWDKIVQALIGFGLLESKSNNTSSEAIREVTE